MKLHQLLELPKAPAAVKEAQDNRLKPSNSAWLRCVWTNYCCYDATSPQKNTIIFTNLPAGALPERRCSGANAGRRPAYLVAPGQQHANVYDKDDAHERAIWPSAFVETAVQACVDSIPAEKERLAAEAAGGFKKPAASVKKAGASKQLRGIRAASAAAPASGDCSSSDGSVDEDEATTPTDDEAIGMRMSTIDELVGLLELSSADDYDSNSSGSSSSSSSSSGSSGSSSGFASGNDQDSRLAALAELSFRLGRKSTKTEVAGEVLQTQDGAAVGRLFALIDAAGSAQCQAALAVLSGLAILKLRPAIANHPGGVERLLAVLRHDPDARGAAPPATAAVLARLFTGAMGSGPRNRVRFSRGAADTLLPYVLRRTPAAAAVAQVLAQLAYEHNGAVHAGFVKGILWAHDQTAEQLIQALARVEREATAKEVRSAVDRLLVAMGQELGGEEWE